MGNVTDTFQGTKCMVAKILSLPNVHREGKKNDQALILYFSLAY